MNYKDWEANVPEALTGDTLWKYEYALGSARESRDWYYNGRFVLGETVTLHRMAFHTHIIRLALTMLPQQRGHTLREEKAEYYARQPVPPPEKLLECVPLPES